MHISDPAPSTNQTRRPDKDPIPSFRGNPPGCLGPGTELRDDACKKLPRRNMGLLACLSLLDSQKHCGHQTHRRDNYRNPHLSLSERWRAAQGGRGVLQRAKSGVIGLRIAVQAVWLSAWLTCPRAGSHALWVKESKQEAGQPCSYHFTNGMSQKGRG